VLVGAGEVTMNTTRLEIPVGAVETKPGLFSHTVFAGKKWMCLWTPFGVSRWVRRKSGLDDRERFVWERDKAQADKSKQDKK
jgi:hypothetical protein